MIVPWWWWSPTRGCFKIKGANQESSREEGPQFSRHSTLQCSRRTRVALARSLDSSSQTKPQDRHTETSQSPPTLELLSPITASSLGSQLSVKCLHQSRHWASTAMTSLDQVSQRPLSISVPTAQSKMCTRDSATTRALMGKRVFPRPFSRTNLIRWEAAQASSSKKQRQLSVKI